ncbi:zinc ribbon domain-containing protein [Bifidobacterium leontopitheci]|uniref:Argininosuccinate synthase n=1 Tax=Bifidobacterium leontopitheci TaxID=2650774 RepID=A0A6I1GF68_9BIFI|nr:zinc ribbon domain-containing protein [Bifidobacterium leontopitheci]KAB7790274.1 argininosuccinate synthase [Bifidobacterium leontopitheci]
MAANTSFDNETPRRIRDFGIPYGVEDPKTKLYRFLDQTEGGVFYSTAPIERVLDAVNAHLQGLDLSRSRHVGGGMMRMAEDGDLFWMPLDGPVGSAVVFIPVGDAIDKHDAEPYRQLLPVPGALQAGLPLRGGVIRGMLTQAGAADIIGKGDVCAAWAVPGYELTAEPYGGSGERGQDSLVMPASLRRTVAGWRREMYSAYAKDFHDHEGNACTVAVMMAVEDASGPSLVMPLSRMSRRKVRSRFGGMSVMGYGTTVLDGDGTGCVFRTITGSETAAQLDELAQCMVDDATYWVEHHAPRPRTTPAAQPATAQPPAPAFQQFRQTAATMQAPATNAPAPAPTAYAAPAPQPSPMPFPPYASPAVPPQPIPPAASAPPAPGAQAAAAQAVTPAATPVFPKRFCTECGAKLPPNARFCGKCGTRV